MHKKIPLPIRFGPRHRRALYGVFLGVWLSGLFWLLFHHFLATPGEFGPAPSPLEKWWLRLHGLFAFATLVALGSVLPTHVHGAWQRKKNRVSGVLMKSSMLWLAATGYALYYFSSEANEARLPLLHWVAGLALPLLLWTHIRRGRARPVSPMPQRSLQKEAPASAHTRVPAAETR
jgi:hypothetical protein